MHVRTYMILDSRNTYVGEAINEGPSEIPHTLELFLKLRADGALKLGHVVTIDHVILQPYGSVVLLSYCEIHS